MKSRKIYDIDACELSRMIRDNYGQEFNVPYLIMQEDRKIERTVSSLKDFKYPGGDKDVENILKLAAEFADHGTNGFPIEELFEAILCDLCFRKKLKPGDYLISFDD